jgi:hypothetical protein
VTSIGRHRAAALRRRPARSSRAGNLSVASVVSVRFTENDPHLGFRGIVVAAPSGNDAPQDVHRRRVAALRLTAVRGRRTRCDDAGSIEVMVHPGSSG